LSGDDGSGTCFFDIIARGFPMYRQFTRNSAILASLMILAPTAHAGPPDTAKSSQHVIYTFTGGIDGAQPEVGLLTDTSGNLYGTTATGGADKAGVVYEVTQAGAEKVLYTFTGGNDGGDPGGLLLDASGNLYGGTYKGGAHAAGVVFKLTPQGSYSVLHTFTGGNDGARPEPTIYEDGAGNLYGAAALGGSQGAGVIFKIAASGKYSVLYTFTGGSDGAEPSGIVMDKSGDIYGATAFGGANQVGVIFKLTSKGKETVLYTFTGGSDGARPSPGIALDSSGNIDDVTVLGGADNAGVAFQVSAKGKYKLLYTFTGGSDGGEPDGGVVLDSAGNLYGPTLAGGKDAAGVLFRISPKGRDTTLYTFTGGTDGGQPSGRVVVDKSGDVFGVAQAGGADSAGVVYELTN
jgi:uncharacterized repeat protein (TIGR03803 family)